MFPNLSKSKNLLLGSVLVAAASAGFLGCQLDPYIITAEEQYTRNFIKDFGLIDPNQDWNLAKEATVTINLGDGICSSVKVYGKVQDTYYLVADLTDISGRIEVPVDVPESCDDFLVKVNNRKFYGHLGETINCADLSRGIPDATYDSEGNPNPTVYEKAKYGYSIKVKHTERGNGGGDYGTATDGYQYFNTQQVSPLISTVPWTKYYSLNTRGWSKDNVNEEEGLLPESGVFNRVQKDLTDMIERKKRNGASIVADFRINTSADGSFTLFPFYYGTNLQHELGVYLMDDEGNPIINKDSDKPNPYDDTKSDLYTLEDFVYFPVFIDRKTGDLQIQPHYDSSIEDIGLFKNFDASNPTKTDKWTFTEGETVNIQQYLYVKVGDTWKKYDEYFIENGSKTHSRAAYHFWVEEVFEEVAPGSEPVVYATVTKDGNVTGVNVTNEAYAEIGIATNLEPGSYGTKITGPSHKITYEVVKKGTVVSTEIKTIEIAEKDKEFELPVGETRTIDITLKDGNGNVLSWDDHFGELKVTKWYNEYIEVFKDNNKIKVTALAVPPAGYDQMWPQVYVGEDPNVMDNNNCSAGFHVTVIPNTTTVTKNHSYTRTYTGESDAMTFDPIWYDYFEPVTYSSIALPIEHSGLWVNENTSVENSNFNNIDKSYRIFISVESPQALQLTSRWGTSLSFDYIADGNPKKSSDGNTVAASEIEVTMDESMVTILKQQGLSIWNKGTDYVTFLEISLRIGRSADGEPSYTWKSTGKAQAADKLAEYYKNNVPTSVSCSCGETHEFSSDATVVVDILDDADRENISYRVTWTYTTTEEVQRTKVARRNRTVGSRSVSSRADSDMPEFLKNNNSWKDVKPHWSRYLPKGEEVASFPTELPMLARSRGYDVILKVEDENGQKKPYVGYLGMYLKMLSSYEIDQDGNESNPEKNKYGDTGGYVVFSQRKFNRTTVENKPSNQISALSVKHPVTGRTFLTFEDMPVTRLGEKYNCWDYSSDRDVNDLIFNISNFANITNDDKELITETPEKDETISWLWAVEDLGSTDDFDFNDMVMKITSVTKNKTVKETDKDSEGNESTSSTSTTLLYKKVTFEPLCAGGTLPLYVQYTKDGKTYTLKPGTFKEKGLDYEGSDFDNAADIIDIQRDGSAADEASEIHSWFGDGTYPSTMMINTSGSGAIKAKTCVLYLKDGFSIEGFGSGSVKGPKGGLTVYVKDDRTQQDYSDITDGDEGWIISKPDPGKVSQMFMIYDANTKWRWPIERTHILNAYPKFKDWVNRPSDNVEWFKGGVKECTVPRNDLGETE